MKPRRIFSAARLSFPFASALVALFAAQSLHSATLVFDSDASSTNGFSEASGTFIWTLGGSLNFLNLATPAGSVFTANDITTDIARFGNGGTLLAGGATINVGTGSINGLIFGATGGSGYTLTNGSASNLSLGTGGIVVNAGAFATSVGSANLGITLGGPQSWVNNSANTLTIGGAITNGTNLLTLQAQSAGDINITGAFTGAGGGGLTVNSTGTGRVILSGNNTHTGTTTLTAGILRATTSANALGAAGLLQLNGGTLQLANDTGLSFGRNTTVGGNTTILSDRLIAGAGVTHTLGTLSLGAFTMNVGAGAFNTSGTAGVTFGASTLTGAGTINTNNSFFNSGVTSLTTLASVGGNFNATFGGTGNTTITGGITGTGALTLTKNGTGTLTLGGGTNPGTGAITINGGTISVTSGGTLGSRALTFGAANTGGGAFTFNAASAGVNQGLGALSFLGGDGVVRHNYGTSANASVTFSSLAARTSGATGLFIASGGANGTTNKIVLTGVTPGANGIVIGGGAAGVAGAQAGGVYFFNTTTPSTGTPSNYAVYDTGGFVRAINYATDTTLGNTVAAAGVLTAARVNQIIGTSGTTGTVTQTAIATVTGLNFSGAGTRTLATAGFQVTTPSILVSGGATAALITSGSVTTGGITSGTADLVIRTDAATDQLTINAPIAGAGITKTGAGTLIVGTGTNTFTGSINVNGGTYAFNTSYNSIDTNFSLGAAGARNINLNGGTLRNSSAVTFNPSATTKALVIGLAGGTFDLNGQQLQLDDASQLSGSGNLTLTNSNATANVVLLGTGAVSYAGFLGNMIVDPAATGNITLRLVNANAAGVTGNTIVMSTNKSTLDLQALINNNIFVGGAGLSGGGAITNTGAQGGTNAGATTTLTADTTITTGTGGLTFNGVVTDAGRGFVLTKNGPSFLALNAANTYSGGTVIAGTNAANGSQLALGNNAALGTGPLTITGTGVVVVANGNYTLTNSVILNQDTNFGLLNNTNTGNMTFGALNLGGGAPRTIGVPVASITTTFTGAVTNGGLNVTGVGTLALSGTGSFTGPVTVNGGGTLSVGATTLNATGSVNIGTTTTSGLNFNADNIGSAANLAANSTVALGGTLSQALLGFQLGNISNYDSLNLSGATGNVTVGAGGAVISISPLTGFTPAPSTTNTYNLITTSGGGTISNHAGITLPIASLPTGYNYGFTTSSTSAVLTVTGGAAGDLFWRGDVNNSWNAGTGTGATDTNWNNTADAADALFAPNATNTVNFSSTGLAGATPVTTTLDQNFSVAGIAINNNNTGALTVNQGAFGTLTLGTGGITLATGGPASSTINAPVALGGNQTWTVTDSGQTLSIQGAAPAQGAVSGAFGVTLAGAGTVTLGGFNTFSGGLTTGAGPLNINNGGSTTTNSALGTGTVNFANATSTLDNTSGVAQAVLTTGAQTWGGNLVFTGTNSLNLGTGTVTLGANRSVWKSLEENIIPFLIISSQRATKEAVFAKLLRTRNQPRKAGKVLSW